MSGLSALLRLEHLRLTRSKALVVASVTCGLIVVLALATRHAGSALATDIENNTADLGLIRLLSLLVPYSFLAGAISEELGARTLVYLTVRPLSRQGIVFGKWLLGVGLSAALLFATALLVHIACTLTTPSELFSGLGHTLAIAAGAALEASVCGAICLAFGAIVPEAAGALSFLYLACFEFLLSFAPGRLRLLSLAHHATELASLPRRGIMSDSVPTFSPLIHASILMAACLAWLAVASFAFAAREYRGSESG